MHAVNGSIAIQCNHANRFSRCDCLVIVSYPSEKCLLLCARSGLHPCRGALPVITSPGPGEAGCEIRLQQNRQIGLQIIADEAVHFEHDFAAQLAAATLIGLGGISEAVTQDDFSGGKGRADDLGDALAPGRQTSAPVQRAGSDRGGTGIEHDERRRVAEGSAAGLARDHDVYAARPQIFGEELAQLGALAAAVETFECDEFSLRHGRSLSSAYRARCAHLVERPCAQGAGVGDSRRTPCAARIQQR